MLTGPWQDRAQPTEGARFAAIRASPFNLSSPLKLLQHHSSVVYGIERFKRARVVIWELLLYREAICSGVQAREATINMLFMGPQTIRNMFYVPSKMYINLYIYYV